MQCNTLIFLNFVKWVILEIRMVFNNTVGGFTVGTWCESLYWKEKYEMIGKVKIL